MKTKHTPGPWHRNIKPASKYNVVWAGRNTHVLAVKTEGLTEEEIEANIDLASAAPDLLAIAWKVESVLSKQKWIANASSHCPEAQLLSQARAAIMLATGSLGKEEWVRRCADRLMSFGGVKYLDDAIEVASVIYAAKTKDRCSPPWPTEAADAEIETWKD